MSVVDWEKFLSGGEVKVGGGREEEEDWTYV